MINKKISSNISISNVDVYEQYNEDKHYGYELVAHEGFELYDTSADDKDIDFNTMQEISIVNYYAVMYLPTNFNFSKIAVREIGQVIEPLSEMEQKAKAYDILMGVEE